MGRRRQAKREKKQAKKAGREAPVVKSERLETYVGPGTGVEGTLRSSGALRIDGKVSGNILCEGDVLIGESGNVEADIEAKGAVIAGTVTGNVVTSGRLELRPTANLQGDVRVGSLAIEDGAQFRGRSEVLHENPDDADIEPIRANLDEEPDAADFGEMQSAYNQG